MAVKFSFVQPDHKLWVLFYQTFNTMIKCEEKVYAKLGITPQYLAVLMALKYIKPPVTPTLVGRWLDRGTNSITMMIDRMERDGLVKRRRDIKDRRSLRLVMTPKGDEAFARALEPSWEMMNQVFSDITEEEKAVLTGLLEKIREKAFQHLAPGAKMIEISVDDAPEFTRFTGETG